MKTRLVLLVAAAGVAVAGCVHPGPYSPTPTAPAPSSSAPAPAPSVAWTWPPTNACGVDRWPVKTGTDADAGMVNLTAPFDTNIVALNSLRPPATLPQDSRISPVELTLYRVHATLVEFKMEADSDYHLVLSDGSGDTMIAEIPDPACVAGRSGPLLPGIELARTQFDSKFHATTSFQRVNIPVTVTGVGFFDFKHGQTGVAVNGIELHPVQSIEFG